MKDVKDDVAFPDDVEFQYEIPQGRILNVYRLRRRRMFTSAVLLYKIYIGIFTSAVLLYKIYILEYSFMHSVWFVKSVYVI